MPYADEPSNEELVMLLSGLGAVIASVFVYYIFEIVILSVLLGGLVYVMGAIMYVMFEELIEAFKCTGL